MVGADHSQPCGMGRTLFVCIMIITQERLQTLALMVVNFAARGSDFHWYFM